MQMLSRKPLGFAIVFLWVLTACGTPATPAPTFEPTLVLPTRVPLLLPAQLPAATGVVAAAITAVPSPSPVVATSVPPTSVPPTATVRTFATATKVTTAVAGDPRHGADLFANGAGGVAPACSTCHYTDHDEVKVGPSLMGVASRAASRVPGQDAYTYLRTSILEPNAYIVQDPSHVFGAGGQSLMYQTYAKDLTPSQIDDLLAYLLTLK
ncbi:MAG TPA: c-type cytochrome [Aggregatilineales bacterium]|nr:c-type cytochrome [Aggregatilineales bacterium]